MVNTSRYDSRHGGGEPGRRFLPTLVILAALVALAGLLSVRADGSADAARHMALLSP